VAVKPCSSKKKILLALGGIFIAVKLWIFGRAWVRIAAGVLYIKTVVFIRSFSPSPQANTGIIPRLAHERFLPNPL
jgi:hypothetical protein